MTLTFVDAMLITAVVAGVFIVGKFLKVVFRGLQRLRAERAAGRGTRP